MKYSKPKVEAIYQSMIIKIFKNDMKATESDFSNDDLALKRYIERQWDKFT